MRGTISDVYRGVGTQPSWKRESVGSRLSLPGVKLNSMTRHRPRSGSQVGSGEVGQGKGVGGRSDSAKWKQGKSGAGSDDIYTVGAVVESDEERR